MNWKLKKTLMYLAIAVFGAIAGAASMLYGIMRAGYLGN